MIADPPVRNGNFHRTAGGHEIENQAQLVILQCGDGVIARRDLSRGSDGVRVFSRINSAIGTARSQTSGA